MAKVVLAASQSVICTSPRNRFAAMGNAGQANPSVGYRRLPLRTAVAAATGAVSDSPTTNLDEMVSFLEQDLPHLFDEQGIDSSRYEENVNFRDPINKYDTLSGYLFNLQLIRLVFNTVFILHKAKQTGHNQITTRWTMNMTFKLLPWKPVLTFTGTSVMDVNLETGKFCSHVDFWDSVKNNEYFSFEALLDVLKQMRPLKTPDLETPQYTVVKRTSCYEIREYKSFIVVESKTDGLASSKGFNNVAGYIFGKNQREEKMKMTTPVFSERSQDSSKLQIVIPSEYELSKLPPPNSEDVKLREVTKVYAAATMFSGKVTEELVKDKERELRSALLRDQLKPTETCVLARYNDPDRTPKFLRRNEVLIWLEEFNLEI